MLVRLSFMGITCFVMSEDSPQQPQETPPAAQPTGGKPAGADKKLLAGILGIVIGSFGVHKFVLGYNKEGIIQIALTVVTCGLAGIIGLIEGIIYLTKSDEEFVKTYIEGKKGWF